MIRSLLRLLVEGGPILAGLRKDERRALRSPDLRHEKELKERDEKYAELHRKAPTSLSLAKTRDNSDFVARDEKAPFASGINVCMNCHRRYKSAVAY